MRNTSRTSAILKSGLAFSTLLCFPQTSFANETDLDDIIIIATRMETEAGKVGSTTHVVTEEDLKEGGATFVSEYLTKLPGISFSQNGGAGKASSLRMRGLSNYYIKVFVDGIDISDPSSPQVEARLEHMLVNDVERIEILKGSQSALYGGQAVGGVINIITKSAEPGLVKHSGMFEAGSYGTVNASYGFKAAAEMADIAVNIQRFQTDGFSAVSPNGRPADDDGYENTTLSAKGSFDATESFNLYFSARSVEGTSEYDGGNDPAANKEVDVTQHFGKVGANYLWLDESMTTDASVQLSDFTRDYSSGYLAKGNRIKLELLNDWDAGESFRLNFGGDWSRENVKGQDQVIDVAGGFVQALWNPVEALNVSGSVRLDEHNAYGSYLTGRGTLSYQVSEGMRFRSSLGNGFRAPSSYELYDSYSGNPDFEPETSISYDIGIDQDLFDDRVSLSFSYFHILTNDLIINDPATYKYEQIAGTSRSQGAEVSAVWDFSANLSFNGAYTYTWAVGPDRKRLERVPLHDVNLGMAYKPIDVLALNLDASYVSGIEDEGELDAFLLVNVKASYQHNENLTFYVRGENLLDQDYERIDNYQTPGLSVYAGLSASF
ncbi:Vitamin B12 transporter BtuB precursor [Pseudovibrio axinellae]|uniref:Vitamin B12 transporter BtuB n=1 Tax=Pseudovibrio axinellae TaxID=989403 RepID=A0A165UM29_9HYPH|nr:TonB-dependent receptor [Pseudovibrio axinellae]KZL12539.1 Vitamin B12 transporter BtuB precursor [Pseudovibrio axinellae]SEP67869.1 vitamin B12 transporter [Pseudovibrio axinellae]